MLFLANHHVAFQECGSARASESKTDHVHVHGEGE